MAFKSITASSGNSENQERTEAIRTAKINVGEVVRGYPVRRLPKDDEPRKANLIFKMEDGSERMVFTSGNFAFLAAEERFVLGRLTEVERIEDGTVTNKKTGKTMKSTKFDVRQDPDNTLDDQEFNAVFDSPTAVEDRKASTQAAVEASLKRGSSVAARAAELASQAAANKRK